MTTKASAIAAFLAALICTGPSFADEDPLDGLEAAIASAAAKWRAPGLSAAIVRDDRVVFLQGSGVRRLGEPEETDARTLFTLASTTKAFVAVALGMLVDEGKLDWDDPVIEHLPEFRVADPWVTREITVRDLLAHRTGVEAADVLWLRGLDTPASLRRMRHAEQATSLRSAWGYNNMLYVAAAEIVSRVADVSFQDFVAQRIFEPLGMDDSRFTGPELPVDGNVAGAHLVIDGRARPITPYRSASPMGAAGIQSTALDMAKWIRMLLAEGSVGERQVVSPAVIAETLTPQIVLAEPAYPAAKEAGALTQTYGLGWFLQDYRGHRLAMHTGSLFGANALVALVPELELGMVILINAGPVEYRHAFMYDVVDRVLGAGDGEWSDHLHQVYADLESQRDEARRRQLAARPSDSRPTLAPAAYAGTYTNPLVGTAEVLLDGERELSLVMRPNARYALEHWSYDSFEASDLRAPQSERFHLAFELGLDGKITGFETDGGREFVREVAED